jgi:predicted enzyme related to lactoylglutathione lyase
MNRVIHFEIHAANPQRAISFYKNVFDWEFNNWGGSEDYWLIITGPDDKPGINGGLIKRRGEIDGQAVIAYVCTIGVVSVDEISKKVISNQGEIVVPKMPIPNVGWLIYCKDTEGNIFGIHQEDLNAK